MNTKAELDKLQKQDIYSLMLFALYKASNSEKYSTLSELAYILDKDSLLKLCEFYGGLTIKIPTIKELQVLLEALILYQEVNIENKPYDEVINTKDYRTEFRKQVEESYILLLDLMKDYDFNSGRV